MLAYTYIKKESLLWWRSRSPNAIVTVVALYDKPQTLPLPEMYGKNLTFKTGGMDGCDCAEILSLIGKRLQEYRFRVYKVKA